MEVVMGLIDRNNPLGIPPGISKEAIPTDKKVGEEGYVKEMVAKFEALSKPETPALAATTNESIDIVQMTSVEVHGNQLMKAGADPHDIQKESIGEIVKHGNVQFDFALVTNPTKAKIADETPATRTFAGDLGAVDKATKNSKVQGAIFNLLNVVLESHARTTMDRNEPVVKNILDELRQPKPEGFLVMRALKESFADKGLGGNMKAICFTFTIVLSRPSMLADTSFGKKMIDMEMLQLLREKLGSLSGKAGEVVKPLVAVLNWTIEGRNEDKKNEELADTRYYAPITDESSDPTAHIQQFSPPPAPPPAYGEEQAARPGPDFKGDFAKMKGDYDELSKSWEDFNTQIKILQFGGTSSLDSNQVSEGLKERHNEIRGLIQDIKGRIEFSEKQGTIEQSADRTKYVNDLKELLHNSESVLYVILDTAKEFQVNL